MKLSKQTITILKNFTGVSGCIIFKPGNTLATISNLRTILAVAKIPEDIPMKAPIYDLGQFLNVISIMEDPDLEFQEDKVVITSGNYRSNYRYSTENVFPTQVPEIEEFKTFINNLKADTKIKFTLTADDIKSITNATSIIGGDFINLVAEGGATYLTVKQLDKDGTNSFKIKVSDETISQNFVYAKEKFKMLPFNYDVYISGDDGNMLLESSENELVYTIVADEE